MHDYSLSVLELPRILSLLEEGAVSEPGRGLCRGLKPAWNFAEVARRLAEVRELMALEATDPLPLAPFADVSGLLGRARVVGALLWPEELNRVHAVLGLARRLRAHLAAAERSGAFDLPLLAALGHALPVPEGLEEAIFGATGGLDEIRDDASPALAAVRSRLKGAKGRVHQTLQKLMDGQLKGYLQDRLVTLRGGRYVLPVRIDAKGSVAGIIHDYSHSKATAFIEPMAVVELNNDLAILAREERREEERVLRRLTVQVGEAASEVAAAQDGLAYLDLLAAKTGLARRLGAVVPQLNRAGRLRLTGAVHPLLLVTRRATPPVPIDIELSTDLRTLIISGPNAGGKTVTLKTVGLLALMAQAGLAIPAQEGSEMPVFGQVLATIGDEQDIEGALSTFSGRMKRTRELLELAAEGSLVLLDEIGTGTDPAEGAALAMAVLDELIAKGAYCLITTHYHLLKAYAFLKQGVANVSLEFDSEGLTPTFRLSYGKPGVSHGLETAAKVGLPEAVVERARGYMSDAERKSASLINELEETLERLRAERGQVERLRAEAEAVKEKRSRELDRLRERRDELLAAERRRAEDIVGRAEREVKLIKRSLGEKKLVETRRLRELRRELDERLRVRGQRRDLDRLREGDRVLVTNLNREATLLQSPEGHDRVAVNCGGMRMELPVWDLKAAAKLSAKPAAQEVGAARRANGPDLPAATYWGLRTQPASREVNLVGMRVEEALPLVDKMLDLAVVAGITTMNIIHGVGTGRLRAAVREHLKNHPQVRAFRPAEGRQAASITLVEVES